MKFIESFGWRVTQLRQSYQSELNCTTDSVFFLCPTFKIPQYKLPDSQFEVINYNQLLLGIIDVI